MSKNYTQTGIAQNFELGLGGKRIRDNTAVGPVGDRVEMRDNADAAFVRCAGLDAVDTQDFVTLAQLQAQGTFGLAWKNPAEAVSTSQITGYNAGGDDYPAATVTVGGANADFDGVTLNTGDRVLIIDSDGANGQGIWEVQADGSLIRTDDAANGESADRATITIDEGATAQGVIYQQNLDNVDFGDPLNWIVIINPAAGVTSITPRAGADASLLPAGPNSGGVTLDGLVEGLGIELGGGGGSNVVITAEIVGNQTVAGAADLVLSNPVGGPTQLRDVADSATVTWSVNGDGNLEADTVSTALPYDTIYYVSLTGAAAPGNDGLSVENPTDLDTAITNANAAGNATIALLDQGTYTTGAAITIIGDNVSIVSFFNQSLVGPLPVQISDAITISATGFSAKGVGFTSTVDVQSSPANFTGCAFGGNVTVSDLASGNFGFDDCSFAADFTISGVASGFSTIQMVDCTSFGGTFTASHSGAGTVIWPFANCPQLQSPIILAQSASGTTGLNLYQNGVVPAVSVTATGTGLYSIGYRSVAEAGTLTLNHTASGDHVVNIEDSELDGITATAVAGTLAFRMYSSRTSGDVDLSSGSGSIALQSSVIGAAGNGALQIAVGYNWETSDTSFTTSPPTSLLGTEITANNDPSGNITSDFSSIRIEAQPTAADPTTTDFDLLFRASSPSRGFVQSVSSTAFQKALQAGQGIDATALAANPATVQTQDPQNGTLAGVKRVLVVTFAGQGDGTVTVGTLPDDARVVRSTVRIDSAATAGQLDLGYNGGTGTELQDGAVANNVASVDTYNSLDSISNAGGGAQTVDAVFSGMTGTATGEIEVEFYVLA